ncbi:MAG: family N-acetyltransferase [Paenibacillus sp.]|jgi:ribosomal protein S18 acetylase RimI-like enzyme|nr:family N-acetyltransferase [Paenibacillus sp.]
MDVKPRLESASKVQVRLMGSIEEAQRISDFFLSEWSFDDTRHTPGEMDHFRNGPFDSLKQQHHMYWYAELEDGTIIAVSSCKENEHRTNGYLWDYLVVHRNFRRLGLASRLYAELENYVRLIGGRYVLTYTCDLPEYYAVQRLFKGQGFEQIGRYPHYYFDGEDRLAYFKKLGYTPTR